MMKFSYKILLAAALVVVSAFASFTLYNYIWTLFGHNRSLSSSWDAPLDQPSCIADRLAYSSTAQVDMLQSVGVAISGCSCAA